MDDKLYKVSEVAVYLRLSRSQVYAMIARRELPHVRLSKRRIIVREKDLKIWMESKAKECGEWTQVPMSL